MTIQITYGTVTAAAGDIRQASNDIGTQLETLNGKVKAVVAQWDGQAQEAFNIKQRGWEEDVRGLRTTLTAIAAALDNATAGYQGTDKRAAARFDF
ncbi:WXG100 family type VII secretion target [Streptomyces sp. 549]|uniref:WXG100 family type VII secretion target n=1 Tax=Streptomyces sp. 549 TaxID=3049076 RepID=UPI0024C34A4A|nr:WXG100 family type VII secretion target [Streptomyces sp. 549]MDK1476954.1 WXG100 family type VII secretion target [Streptomyces sp. 549]